MMQDQHKPANLINFIEFCSKDFVEVMTEFYSQ